jgi:hypothetical protein
MPCPGLLFGIAWEMRIPYWSATWQHYQQHIQCNVNPTETEQCKIRQDLSTSSPQNARYVTSKYVSLIHKICSVTWLHYRDTLTYSMVQDII